MNDDEVHEEGFYKATTLNLLKRLHSIEAMKATKTRRHKAARRLFTTLKFTKMFQKPFDAKFGTHKAATQQVLMKVIEVVT